VEERAIEVLQDDGVENDLTIGIGIFTRSWRVDALNKHNNDIRYMILRLSFNVRIESLMFHFLEPSIMSNFISSWNMV